MFTLPGLRATKEAECLLYAARRISSVELPIFAFEQLDSLGNNVFLIASAGDNIARHVDCVSADQVPGFFKSKTSGGYKLDECASKKKSLKSTSHSLMYLNLWWRTYAYCEAPVLLLWTKVQAGRRKPLPW